ncbi:MAG TPA: RodZ domain-containing protein [Thermohalobaculum sp.]|nr:RodZ domain-containing protein [Thermohalobaculum sp.]
MSLEGMDDYAFTLGDEMRERRASLGLGLEDAERDLRIRAGTILAIESGDLSGFPSEGVIPGYVRSYSRYLGLDPQRSYRRFCDETGFRSSSAAASGRAGGNAGRGRTGADLTRSRFAPPPAPDRIGSRVSLGALGSGVALIALVGGLSYGGYQLLQDIQKVGMAPLPEVPEVVVETETSPDEVVRTASADGGAARPDASAYEDGGILTLSAATDPLPPRLTSRDGPIADLDPNESGLFAGVGQLDPLDPRRDGPPPAEVAAAEETAKTPASPSGWDDGVLLASLSAEALSAEPPTDAELLTMSARAETQALAPKSQSTMIRATAEAWIRVRDGDGTVVFEGILAPGETFELPERMSAPELRAGNAGGVFIAIGGESYGPVGAPGQVVNDISLEEEDVREAFPAAERIEPASVDGPVQRAQATL